MYILRDGTEVTAAQIKEAVKAGTPVIVHGRAENHNSTSLMLDGQHRDTRGQCHSMWDEVWTRTPTDVAEALKAARYNYGN
jgi:hypothetical protein